MRPSDRRSYANRQRSHSADMIHYCTWCGRNMVDVLEIAGSGAGEILFECINRRACMKERTVQAIKARDLRAAELEAAAAARPLAGLVAAFDAEAARMRATMGDQPAGRDWLAMGPGEFDTAPAAPVQLAMFGEDEARGQLTLGGQH